MKITTTMTATIAFSILCITGGHYCRAQSGGTADAKPVVTLIVKLNPLTISRRSGIIPIIVDAAAPQGFAGTISGTITISQPSNPSGVLLSAGFGGQTTPFTLTAGQKTSDTTPPQTVELTIRTSPKNPTSGTLTYVVGIDPSARFTSNNSPEEVKVITVP
ncbi:MAG: hypothetical protein ACR2NN_07625 [Bryobacteraceae bacterium]